MTRINKMVMHGFKSFAKYTELLFNTSFNCVLGPNGSGKSNVLDALCFVLGKTSSKSLRAEKSANLIYNGGKAKNPAKQGEVSIFFDNTKKVFPTEEKEVKVSRIVRQNGQSIYKINDKKRTRQEVIELLHLAKIDPDGYNIILQGDIVRFVEMAPVERRLLIEEVAGISVYEEKKQKAMHQLEKVEERLKSAEIVLAERNTYLKDLKKDRDQAMKFKDMTTKIKTYRASLLKLQMNEKEKEKEDMEKKAGTANEEMQKIQEKVDKLQQQVQEKKQEIEIITKEVEEKGEVEQVNLNKEIEALKIDATRKQSRMDTVKGEISKIKQRKEDLKKELGEIHLKIEEIEKQKQSQAEEKKKLIGEKSGYEERVNKFKEKNKLGESHDIDKQIEDLDKKAEELQKDIVKLREQEHHVLREKDKREHQINTIDEEVKKVKGLVKEHQDQVQDLEKKRGEFKKSTLELNKLLDEDSRFAAEVGNAKQDLHKAHEELAKLRIRETSLKEAQGGDFAVRKILDKKNNLKGVHGTVATLGEVNSRYALALEVSAGPRIKSIVVENDQVASDAIKFLKKNKFGVASFLPINKIKGKVASAETSKLAKAEGCHGFAIDLVDYDAKFKKIFQYVFSDTIVVDNIDVARRIGIGKARMVTLDGDKAEISGVMQGGFRNKKGKGMGFGEKELLKNIREQEGAIAKLESDLDGLEKERSQREEAISGLRVKKGELEGEISKIEKSLHLEHGDSLSPVNKKKTLMKEVEQFEEELRGVQQKVSETNHELAQLKIEKMKLREQITQLRNPTLVAELNTFNQKIKEIDERLIQMETEIKGMDMQVKEIHQPEIEKTGAIVKQHGKEEEDFNKEMHELQKMMKETQKILDEKEEKATAFFKQFKGLFTKRTTINDEINKLEIQINGKREEKNKGEIKNNTFTLKLAEVRGALAGMQEAFNEFEGVELAMEKNEQQLRYEIGKFEKAKDTIGNVNMRALEIYDEVEKEYNSLLEKKDNLRTEKDDVVKLMEEIEGKKKELFMKNFDVVNQNFKEIFSHLSNKGEANMVLEVPDQPFEGGLRIVVRITGNKFLDIRSLSGGEKTMTALAFIFAIQDHEPASFYVLDEVDAALDKHNAEKLASLIRKYSEKAQYVIISHNDGVISEADTLYGVSMNEHGMSQVVSLKV